MKVKLYKIITLLLLLLLLFTPNQTFQAAKEGLLLWFNVILPTLLPFIILSNLIIRLNIIRYISIVFKPFMKLIFNLPGSSGYALFLGMLSGYPMGAKITGDLVRNNYINKPQAQYLLTFCNNASPMFILGFVAISQLGVGSKGLIMLFIIYSSSIITGIILKCFLPKNNIDYRTKKFTMVYNSDINFKLIDSCIMDAFELIVKVGGYIILFSIILNIFSWIPISNILVKSFMLGTIEVSNGVHIISKLNTSMEIKIILANTLVSFGGFSILAQTESVLNDTGLSIVKYMLSKLLNALITFVISIVVFFVIL